MGNGGNFFDELKRRNVFRVGIAYLVVGWLMIEVVDTIAPRMAMPEWVPGLIIILVLVGLPITLFLAWAFELTPEGVKKAEDVDPQESVSASTGQKLNYLIIGALVLVVGFLLFDRSAAPPQSDNRTIAETPMDEGFASIAVLAFDDLSPSGDQEYFADGLSEEILNVLVGVDGLTVASRTSSFQFKEREAGIPEIASQLNVTFVLEGSVRKAGGTIRVTGQLIEAATDRHLWSDTFDRQLTTENIFAIQEEIATAIVAALGEELGVETAPESIEVKAGTSDLSAYEAYLAGREKFTNRASPAAIQEAVVLLEAATAADPAFADAWQFLAATNIILPSWLSLLGEQQADNLDYFVRGEAAARTALRLDPELAFAHAVLGQLAQSGPDHDQDAAVSGFKTALALDPKDATAHLWLGIAYRTLGFFDLSDLHLSRCLAISPLYLNCHNHKWTLDLYLGRTEDAERTEERLLELAPAYRMGIAPYARRSPQLIRNGDILGARRLIAETAPNPGAFPVDGWIAAVQNPDGDHMDTVRQMDAWLKTVTIWPNSEARLFLILGAFDRIPVVEWDDSVPWFWVSDLQDYRRSAGFKAGIRNLNIDDYWRKNGFPPQCRPIGADDFACD